MNYSLDLTVVVTYVNGRCRGIPPSTSPPRAHGEILGHVLAFPSVSTYYTHTSIFLFFFFFFNKMRSYCIACFGTFSPTRASCPLHHPLSLKFYHCCSQTFWSLDSFMLLKIMENSKEVFQKCCIYRNLPFSKFQLKNVKDTFNSS